MTDDDDDGLDGDTVMSSDAMFDEDLGGATVAASGVPAPVSKAAPPARRTQIAPAQPPRAPAPAQAPRTPPQGQPVQPQRTRPSAPRVEARPQPTPPAQQRVPEPVARGSRALDAAAPAGPRSKGALARTDTVPEFRRDLQLTRVENGYAVHDPVTGREHVLNEYEVSLARMLNGQRPAFEVLDAIERLGIPINPESLTNFIGMLEQLGFLRPPQPVDDAVDKAMDGAWASRGQWESGVRAMFQSGIRLLRMGKHEEAAGYFEAMLAEDPDNVEARELLALAKNPPVSAQMPAVGNPSMAMAATMPQPVAFPGPMSAPMPMQAAPMQAPSYPPPGPMYAPMPVQAPPFAPHDVQPAPRAGGRRWQVPVVIAGVLLVGGLVGYLVTRGSRSDTVKPSDKPVAAIVADAAVGGAPVDAAVIVMATADASPPDVAVAATVPADAAVAETAPADAAVVAEVVDAGVKPVDNTPKQPRVQPPRPIGAPIAGEVTSFLPTARKVTKGEKLFEIANASADPAKVKALTAKVAELTAMAKKDAVYEEFLADAKADLAKLTRGSKSAVVRAPRAGLATPKVQTGASVRSGQALADIR